MKIVIQRVAHAQVEVSGSIVGKIGPGALVLIGVAHGDTETHVARMVDKFLNLRIFEDEQGKMNKSILDIQGQVLVVSQFTLYADCSGGRRPSFIQAAEPQIAKKLYENFAEEIGKRGVHVETGVFGAEMKVSLLNDGPVTLILENP